MFHREGQKIILFSFVIIGASILLAHFFIDI
ncbi:MAG: phosphatidylserine decarboxylase family protein, partial [Maribacter sp.]|nr:phosphatidylserine decarboxylase family protein [Maribacter sp.]